MNNLQEPHTVLPSEGQTPRNFPLDVLRVLACLLVIWQHTSECYYIQWDGRLNPDHSTYVLAFLNSLSRASVPLFVMISGYFLLPMRDTAQQFFRRRFSRVLGPFVLWCAAYAVYYVFRHGDSLGQCLQHIAHIPVNYGTEVGHLWYVYMLLGLYLLVPVLSPWLQQCSRCQLQGYLALWGVTALLPYIHLIFPEVLGECFWNQSPMLYYFNGFVGYFLLGHYARRYGLSGAGVSLVLLLVGYAATSLIFYHRVPTSEWASQAELSWEFCSLNVAMMAVGVFSLVQRIPWRSSRLVTDMALVSYAIYLAHIMVLDSFNGLFHGRFAGIMPAGLDPVLLEVPCIALCTLATTYLIVRLLAFLPKSKYWLGA